MSKFKTQLEKSQYFYKYEVERIKEYKRKFLEETSDLPKVQQEKLLKLYDWAINASSIKSRNYTIIKQLKNEQD